MIKIINHPLIKHKITLLRDKNTDSKNFRTILQEISNLMCYEATQNLQLQDTIIETPLQSTTSKEIYGKKLTLIPILRSGLEMCQGIQKLIPSAKIGHIGLYKDKYSKDTMEYFCKLPDDIESRDVLLLEPLISTGEKTSVAIQFIQNHKVKNITLICLISSSMALKGIIEKFPNLKIFVAEVDNEINKDGFLSPGVGDISARLYGTI